MFVIAGAEPMGGKLRAEVIQEGENQPFPVRANLNLKMMNSARQMS